MAQSIFGRLSSWNSCVTGLMGKGFDPLLLCIHLVVIYHHFLSQTGHQTTRMELGKPT